MNKEHARMIERLAKAAQEDGAVREEEVGGEWLNLSGEENISLYDRVRLQDGRIVYGDRTTRVCANCGDENAGRSVYGPLGCTCLKCGESMTERKRETVKRCEVTEDDGVLLVDGGPLSFILDQPNWYGLEWPDGEVTMAEHVTAWRRVIDGKVAWPAAVLFRKD